MENKSNPIILDTVIHPETKERINRAYFKKEKKPIHFVAVNVAGQKDMKIYYSPMVHKVALETGQIKLKENRV